MHEIYSEILGCNFCKERQEPSGPNIEVTSIFRSVQYQFIDPLENFHVNLLYLLLQLILSSKDDRQRKHSHVISKICRKTTLTTTTTTTKIGNLQQNLADSAEIENC